MKRVIGLGGPFIKANDAKALAEWYEKHLGIAFNGTTYAMFGDAAEPNSTLLSFFKNDSAYFAPSEKAVMVNLRVADLDALLPVLREEGVTIVGDPVSEEYGKFGWILDPEGNKIELWQPPV
jgi:predicted enzyme related to lactoylglutathione lyase